MMRKWWLQVAHNGQRGRVNRADEKVVWSNVIKGPMPCSATMAQAPSASSAPSSTSRWRGSRLPASRYAMAHDSLEGRRLKVNAKFESGSSLFIFKR